MKVKHLFIIGTAFAALSVGASYRSSLASDHAHGHEENHEDGHGDEHKDGHEEGRLKFSPEQMKASGIEITSVREGSLDHEVSVQGQMTAAADRMAQIVPKVSGVVTEARKNLGDKVKKGEVMALIESRDMAEAAAEYQAAGRSAELAKTMYEREKTLWQKKITAEQDYLSARNGWQESQTRLDLARQKMEALGVAGGKASRYHEMKSPLDGVVIERELTLGEFVDASHKAFTVADLSVLWIETFLTPGDLAKVKEGQTAFVRGGEKKGQGKLIFISPVLSTDTRSAKAVIELDNREGQWRSGDYASVSIVTKTQNAGLVLPLGAIQNVDGKTVVFVRTEDGFEQREVVIGKKDGDQTEIASGLTAGEQVAVGNTFVLKAEAGKAEAEHAH